MNGEPIADWIRDSTYIGPKVREQSASVIQIDTGKHVAAVAWCAALCGISVAVAIWAAYTARDSATEARLVEYYLMDPNSRTPEELAAWAKFRAERSGD